MGVQETATLELERRVTVLAAELERWTQETDGNVDGFGIHQRQIQTLGDLLRGLVGRQKELLATLQPGLPPAEFGALQLRLCQEVSASHEVWDVFRRILLQRRDPALRAFLDAADLVAASCYTGAMDRMVEWKLLTGAERRAAPLVYLDAALSPAAISRDMELERLDATLESHRRLKLPVPVVTLPFDHTTCPWLLAAIPHEVGHNLDQDLALRKPVLAAYLGRLVDAGGTEVRQPIWARWAGEIVADALGVLLGGLGFAHALMGLLRMVTVQSGDEPHETTHPHPLVRTTLVAELLRASGLAEGEIAATELLATWAVDMNPAWLADYQGDARVVARSVMQDPLAPLGGHALRDLAPSLDADHALTGKLAAFIRSGIGGGYDPKTVPHRLVPAAAQTAVARATDATTAFLDGVHARTLSALAQIARPSFLSTPENTAFLRKLVAELDLTGGDRP